jgi:hypothetical protein
MCACDVMQAAVFCKEFLRDFFEMQKLNFDEGKFEFFSSD